MREIVREPESRFNWWIMKTFKVLPTSPEFQALTGAQRTFIWESYLEDNPKVREKIDRVNYDSGFDEEWDRLDAQKPSEGDEAPDDTNIPDDDEDLSELAQRAYEALQSDDETKLEPARDRLREKGITIDAVDDWQEVDEGKDGEG